MRSSKAIVDTRAPRRVVALAAFASGTALAYPDASPWGAANPAADETCSTCHYDYDPVRDSAAIDIVGLPETVLPGSAHDLRVRITGIDAAVSGFQLVATAGAFGAGSGTLESTGTAVRTTTTAAYEGVVEWSLSWQAPDLADDPVVMYLAVSASNDDQSAFGDAIHYRRFVVDVRKRAASGQ